MTTETTPSFSSRSEWRRAYSRRRNGYLRAGNRFVEDSPHEAPAHVRRPYTASQWIALSVEERREHHKKNAREFVLSKIGPIPGEKPTLTLSQLEARVIEQANEHADDLRFILNGDAETVEAIVAAQLPAFRADVFDRLVTRHRIIEG